MSSKAEQEAFTGSTELTLANDQKIPQIQLGVWESYDEECYNAVKQDIEGNNLTPLLGGIRAASCINILSSIDSAEWYANEAVCGRAIHGFLSSNPTLTRSSIFFTTKLQHNVSYSHTRAAIKKSLKECGLGYIDLYLIHAPYGGPKLREELYRGVLDAVDEGEVKGWGVSNYGVGHIQELIDKFPTRLPLVNQIELNPFNTQSHIVDICRKNNIILQAYSPLAKSQRLDDPTLVEIAKKHGRTTAEVMIKWTLQEGFISLPKSVTRKRIVGNLKGMEGWGLEEDDMEVLRGLDEHFVTEWDPTDCE
ncbi:hypothetical protein ABW19_dt0205053 [Dactylella cylindrospora]|nr:hypothetical protein ABW19_dt0205053 [Dactylella cylindrospora]